MAGKKQRFHWVKAVQLDGKCLECSWRSKAANAQGQAVQHHDLYGHTVEVLVARTYVYETTAKFKRRTGHDAPSGTAQGKLL